METAADTYRYGCWVCGAPDTGRRLVAVAPLYDAAAQLDERFEPDAEQYLSLFAGADDYADWVETRGSDAGFLGTVWCPYFVVDFDLERDPGAALASAARLCAALLTRAGVDPDDTRFMFSGWKGAHVVLPGGLCGIEPGADCPARCRAFAERLTAWAGGREGDAAHDPAMYTRARICRLANSRHPKTGLFRVALPVDLPLLSSGGAHLLAFARDRAAEPHAFEWLTQPSAPNPTLLELWRATVDVATRRAEALATRGGRHFVTRATRRFLTNGADPGARHMALFDAARNLRECGCPLDLALDLLTEPARDSGLPPRETERTIQSAYSEAST